MLLNKKYIVTFLVLLFSVSVKAQTVYITKTGDKYHQNGCMYLSHSKFSIEKSNTIDRGYGACSVCRPSSFSSVPKTQQRGIINNQNGSSIKENRNSMSVQCSATTKAGTRCKRLTKNSNGYCFQH